MASTWIASSVVYDIQVCIIQQEQGQVMERYQYSAVCSRVVDGDTIVLDVSLGFNVTIRETFRLLGINSPESYGVKKDSDEYNAGMISKEWLIDRIEGKEIMVKTYKDKKGKYGRYLVDIYDGETSINTEMVEKGLAVEYDGGKR